MPESVPTHAPTSNMGISVICGVKNRADPLRYTIPTILTQPLVKEIVLVDWDSDVPLIETLAKLDIPGWPDPRVMIVRAKDEPFWISSRAYNLGMKMVSQPLTLKVDADILIIDDLARNIPQPGQNFVAGNWRVEQGDQMHLHGTTLFATWDFHSVGGYDERIDSYGCEDDDFYQRLVGIGLERRNLARRSFFHLPHSTGKRMAHQKTGMKDASNSIERNRDVIMRRSRWNAESTGASYQSVSVDKEEKYVVVIAADNVANDGD